MFVVYPTNMMQRYATPLIAFFVHLTCFAQTGVLNSSEMLPPGSIVVQRVMSDVSVLDTTIQGQNVTWNFTAITPLMSQQPFNNEVMLPSSTPHPTTFPASNYVVFETEIPRYSYFSLTPQSFSRVGGWVDQASIYSDPQIELIFPLSYGVSNLDTWDNNISSFGGTYQFTCIGSGALQLPGHTYSDVLMLRGKAHELFDTEFYSWYDATNGAMLLLYYPGDNFWVPTAAAYATSTSVGVDELSSDLGLRIHTLVQDQLPVTYASSRSLDWTMMDVGGHLLSAGNLPANTTSTTEFLDVSGFAPGVYLLVLTSDRERKAARFVVQ